jgi:hypothetical protein
MRRPPWLGAVAFVIGYAIFFAHQMSLGLKPPPRLDWAFALVFYSFIVWVGHSLFRIVRGLVRIGRNLRDLRRDVR